MPGLLPGKSHGQRNLVGYSPWSCKRVKHDLATKEQWLAMMWRKWVILTIKGHTFFQLRWFPNTYFQQNWKMTFFSCTLITEDSKGVQRVEGLCYNKVSFIFIYLFIWTFPQFSHKNKNKMNISPSYSSNMATWMNFLNPQLSHY